MTSHFTLSPIHPHLCIWLFSLEGIFNRGSTTLAQHPHCKGWVCHSTLRTPISSGRILWLFTSSFHFFRVLFLFCFSNKTRRHLGTKACNCVPLNADCLLPLHWNVDKSMGILSNIESWRGHVDKGRNAWSVASEICLKSSL